MIIGVPLLVREVQSGYSLWDAPPLPPSPLSLS